MQKHIRRAVCLLVLSTPVLPLEVIAQNAYLPNYTPKVNLELYSQALQYKQQQYDDNVNAIQREIAVINDLIESLADLDGEQADAAGKQLKEFVKGKLNGINHDYGDQRIYGWVMESLGIIKSNVRKRIRYVNQQQKSTQTVAQPQTAGTTSVSPIDVIKVKVQEEKYDEAIDVLNILIAEASDPAYYLEWRARVYFYGIRNYDKAAQDYSAYIKMRPNDGKAYYNRGEAYRYAGKNAEAIKDFTMAISRNPADLDAHFARGLVKSELDDRNGAIADYDVIIALLQPETKPETFLPATVYNNKGYCLIELGKYAEALPFINKALELDANESYIWSSRGELYYKQGKYKEAIRDMTKSIQLDNDHLTKAKGEETGYEYYIRGMSKIKTGDKGGGCADLSKAGELGSAEAYKAIKEKCQ